MLEVELFTLRNQLDTKVDTSRVGELMMQIAELQRDVADLKTSMSRHQFEEETIRFIGRRRPLNAFVSGRLSQARTVLKCAGFKQSLHILSAC
jgi:hypothetical protein